MKSFCAVLLALAVFGVFAEAFVVPHCPPVNHGVNPCGNGFGTSVCDTCQCVKTISTPSSIEHIPYACRKCVQLPHWTAPCYPTCSVVPYSGANVLGTGSGYLPPYNPCLDGNVCIQTC